MNKEDKYFYTKPNPDSYSTNQPQVIRWNPYYYVEVDENVASATTVKKFNAGDIVTVDKANGTILFHGETEGFIINK